MDRSKIGTNKCKIILKSIVMITCGYICGYILQKTKIYDPGFIRKQMIFESTFLIKLLLSAIATGQLCLCFLTMAPPTTPQTMKHFQNFLKFFVEKNIFSNIVGGYILGIGIYLAGSFPGLEMIQIGAGIYSSGWFLAGIFVGIRLYVFLPSKLLSFFNQEHHWYENPLLNYWLFTPYPILALPIGAILGVVVCGIELVSPWILEISAYNSGGKSVFALDDVWPPYVTGAIIGWLQMALVVSDIGLLCSHSHCSYNTSLSQILCLNKIKYPELNRNGDNFHNWLQILFMVFMCIGSYASLSSSETIVQIIVISKLQRFVGGTLVAIGIKLSGSCFLGHCMTGATLLAVPSLITLITIFIGSMSIMKLYPQASSV